MPLLIDEEDVRRSLAPAELIVALEDAFKQHGLGMAQTLPRREVRIRGKQLPHADPRMVRIAQGLAFLETSGVVVIDHIFTIFHSPGVTLQDAAAAHRVYQNAKKLGYGIEVADPFQFNPENKAPGG